MSDLPHTPDAPVTQKPEKPGLIGGPRMLAIFLGVLACVPLFVWLTLQWVEANPVTEKPLDWSERASWTDRPVKYTPLQKPEMKPLFESGPMREVSFDMTEDEEVAGEQARVTKLAADLATRLPAPAAVAELEALAAEHPELFYPRYLLGWQSRLEGSPAADDELQGAFALAPAVVKLRFRTPEGEPATNLNVGEIRIANEKVSDYRLIDRITLVYPQQRTDAEGYVYLPVFDTVYRLEAGSPPDGVRIKFPANGWFEFPTRIGALPPATVHQAAPAQ